MSGYERFPPDGPSRRALWLIIILLILVIAANLISQTIR